MVIDIDYDLFFKVDQPRPVYVGALNNENRIVWFVYSWCDSDICSAWQGPIGVGNGVAHDDFGVFIKCAQKPIKAK